MVGLFYLHPGEFSVNIALSRGNHLQTNYPKNINVV